MIYLMTSYNPEENESGIRAKRVFLKKAITVNLLVEELEFKLAVCSSNSNLKESLVESLVSWIILFIIVPILF